MMASPFADDLAGRPSAKLISEYSPAAGTNAAVNWQDYGRSRWQLSYQIKVRRLPSVT